MNSTTTHREAGTPECRHPRRSSDRRILARGLTAGWPEGSWVPLAHGCLLVHGPCSGREPWEMRHVGMALRTPPQPGPGGAGDAPRRRPQRAPARPPAGCAWERSGAAASVGAPQAGSAKGGIASAALGRPGTLPRAAQRGVGGARGDAWAALRPSSWIVGACSDAAVGWGGRWALEGVGVGTIAFVGLARPI
jgi:hypothetical protein